MEAGNALTAMDEQTADAVMRQIFHGVAMRTAGTKGASKVLVQGEVYHLCSTCVYKGMPDEEEINQAEDRFIPYDEELPCFTTTVMSNFRPEVLLDHGAIQITQDTVPELIEADPSTWFVPCKKAPSGNPGMMILHPAPTGSEYDVVLAREIPFPENSFFHQLPIRPASFPSEIQSTLQDFKVNLGDFKSEILRAKLRPVLVLMLRFGASMLYVTTNSATAPNTLDSIFNPANNLLYCGDGWDDNKKEYKSIIKVKGSKKMKGLANPLSIGRNAKAAPLPPPSSNTEEAPEVKNDAIPMGETAEANASAKLTEAATPAAAVAVEAKDDDTELNSAMEAASAATEEPAPAVADTPNTEQAQQPSQEAQQTTPAQEQEGQPEEKPRKRQRKAPAKVGYDFSEVLAYVGSPVDEIGPDEIAKAEEEVRNLRDLSIAASRRMANIALKITESSKDAVVTVARLHEMLGKK